MLLGLVSCEKCLKQGGDLEIPSQCVSECGGAMQQLAGLSPVGLAAITYMPAPLFLQHLYCLIILISTFQAGKVWSTIALLHSVRSPVLLGLLLIPWARQIVPSGSLSPQTILNVSINSTAIKKTGVLFFEGPSVRHSLKH